MLFHKHYLSICVFSYCDCKLENQPAIEDSEVKVYTYWENNAHMVKYQLHRVVYENWFLILNVNRHNVNHLNIA